jgi:hypothetical protein
MAMNYSQRVISLIISILASSILLVSCSAPRLPIFIQNVWVSEPPTVGKIVRLGIRVKSIGDQDKILVTVKFPETIAVIESPLRWEFGLGDQEEKDIFSDICVLETGAWAIKVGITSFFANGEVMYGDREVIGVISYPSESRVLLEKDITYSQAAETQRSNYEGVKVSIDECSR